MATKRKKADKTAASKKQVAAEKQSTTIPEAPQAPRDDSDEIVVFAIRLKRSERDQIHEIAGSGKASRFVRNLAVAAAGGDLKRVREIVESPGK